MSVHTVKTDAQRTTVCPGCGRDPFPLLVEKPEGSYYVGPIEPAKAFLLDNYSIEVDYREATADVPAHWRVVEEESFGTWGAGPTEEEAWRWFAGADFGPLDAEYDDARLRQMLDQYAGEGR